MQKFKITVRLADRTVDKLRRIVETQRELYPEAYAKKDLQEHTEQEVRIEAEEYFDLKTGEALRFWERRLEEKIEQKGRGVSWIIRWENGEIECSGLNIAKARAYAEEKAERNGMSYVIPLV